MEHKNFKTSVAYMLEFARRDIEQHAAPDQLRAYQHGPAPIHPQSTSPIPSPLIVGGQTASQGTVVRPSGHGAAHAAGKSHLPVARAETHGSLAGGGTDKRRFEHASDAIAHVGDVSAHGASVAKVFRHGLNVAIRLPSNGSTRDVLRKARISCWRVEKALHKAGDALETAHQVSILGGNLCQAKGRIEQIVTNSTTPWDTKVAMVGAQLSAISLKSIATIGWEVPHQAIEYSRTAAAFFGSDVSHPVYDGRCRWRTYASWHALNFLDVQVGYLTETVYDGDSVYAFIHTHVR